MSLRSLLVASIGLLAGSSGCVARPEAHGSASPPASAASLSPIAVAPAPRAARSESVSRVIDGDTLVTASGLHVRILGIDTPEKRDASPILRLAAEEARLALAGLVEGRRVELILADPPLDFFGRTLAYVEFVDEDHEVDVGAELLEEGLARTYPSTHPRLSDYLETERAAREAGRGVWTREARDAWGPRAEISISPAGARANIGRIARVEGLLARTRRTRKALFLFVEDGGGTLKAVAFRLPLFPESLVRSWEGRRIAVTGLLKSYEGEPEIVIDRPDQVELPAFDAAP